MQAIQATWKRIFVSVDLDYKNHYTFDSGLEIQRNRQFNEFNRRISQPVNGTVIHSHFITAGAEVLLHHNACHATYEIPDYKGLDGEHLSTTIQYFSIPETECYAWRIGDEDWQPCPGFGFGLRIFKPYTGALSGFLPTQIKNKLFITTGEFKDKAVITTPYSDYEIIYQDKNGREGNLIRLRHFKEPNNLREQIIGVCNDTTEKIIMGEYMVGYSPQTAYEFQLNAYAD